MTSSYLTIYFTKVKKCAMILQKYTVFGKTVRERVYEKAVYRQIPGNLW